MKQNAIENLYETICFQLCLLHQMSCKLEITVAFRSTKSESGPRHGLTSGRCVRAIIWKWKKLVRIFPSKLFSTDSESRMEEDKQCLPVRLIHQDSVIRQISHKAKHIIPLYESCNDKETASSEGYSNGFVRISSQQVSIPESANKIINNSQCQDAVCRLSTSARQSDKQVSQTMKNIRQGFLHSKFQFIIR